MTTDSTNLWDSERSERTEEFPRVRESSSRESTERPAKRPDLEEPPRKSSPDLREESLEEREEEVEGRSEDSERPRDPRENPSERSPEDSEEEESEQSFAFLLNLNIEIDQYLIDNDKI